MRERVIQTKGYTVEPLSRGHPDERPPLLERPLDTVNLNIDIFMSTPDERSPLLMQKGWPHKRGSTVFNLIPGEQVA